VKGRRIIGGHGTKRAMESLSWTHADVARAEHLTDVQVRGLRIALNRTAELATWNPIKLRESLRSLAEFRVGFPAALGFDTADMDDLAKQIQRMGVDDGGNGGTGVDIDNVPAPPDEPITQKGDLWILGNHRLLNGDSSKPDDLDRLLGGEPIHLVNTDPPYNVKVEPRSNNAIAAGLSSFQATNTHPTNHHQGLDLARHPEKAKPTQKKLRAKDRPLANDFVTEEAFDRLLDAWFGNIARVLVPGRGFYCWGGYANCANYPPFFRKHQLYFSQAIIWVKEHPVLTRKDFMGNHEWCFYGWKEGGPHQFYGPKNVPDVWELSRATAGHVALGKGVRLEASDGAKIDVLPADMAVTSRRAVAMESDSVLVHGMNDAVDVWRVKKVNPQAMVHLTEKPVELAARAMRLSSRPGENVLDLFGGSGSTLMGAEQTGRRAFLMELDPLYCDVIVSRWEQFTGRKAERIPASAG